MRHVRILGLCLVAVFAMSAVAAVPALAEKDPYSVATWSQYKYCPYNTPANEIEDCFIGRTSGGPKGGYFSLGGVTVRLNKPIILQGGFFEDESRPGAEEGSLAVIPAANGGETLESPELTVNGGMGLINPGIQERSKWPAALKASFKEAKLNKETHLNVKIELAGGNLLYEEPNALNTEHLLFEKGNAFELPLKVRLINPWLAKLGGGPCQVGNDANPVIQDLTTVAPGRAIEPGGFKHNENFTQIELAGSRLTDLNWSVPPEGDASGCGGEYESYVDAAINEVLELPRQHGTTVLQGDLFTAFTKTVKHEFETGTE